MTTEREKILKAKGYRFDCSAVNHDSAVMKAKNLRRVGWFATVCVEFHNGIPYYSIWSKPKKGIDRG